MFVSLWKHNVNQHLFACKFTYFYKHVSPFDCNFLKLYLFKTWPESSFILDFPSGPEVSVHPFTQLVPGVAGQPHAPDHGSWCASSSFPVSCHDQTWCLELCPSHPKITATNSCYITSVMMTIITSSRITMSLNTLSGLQGFPSSFNLARHVRTGSSLS